MEIPKLAPVLKQTQTDFLKSIPTEVADSLTSVIKTFHDTFDSSHIPNIGDTVPSFTLSDSSNKPISLDGLLKTHKAVVLTWYRGGWCPYCNLALHSLIGINDIIEKHGAKLVALSPELPDESMTTTEKHNLPFVVLSDVHCKLAEQYGIAFDMDDVTIGLLGQNGVDAHKFNGNDQVKGGQKLKPRLPLPATFVIDSDKKVVFKFAELDYTKRVEPQEIVDAVKSL